MIILIAESKTMEAPKVNLRNADGVKTPMFISDAALMADAFASMPIEEIAERINISFQLAAKAKLSFYDFHDSSLSMEAMDAFTGEVFKALGSNSLSTDARKLAFDKLVIISSVYGWLRADDHINPYRFDYNVEHPVNKIKMQRFWRPKVTEALADECRRQNETEILDLLPAEAAKCIDWKKIAPLADVMKADFKTPGDSGKMKTPHSGKLKELRGKLLRTILSENITSFSSLLNTDIPQFSVEPCDDVKGQLCIIAS